MKKLEEAKKTAIAIKKGSINKVGSLFGGMPKSGKIGIAIGLGALLTSQIATHLFDVKIKSQYRSKDKEKNIPWIFRGY